MAKKGYTSEQIIGYLHQAEIIIGSGRELDEVMCEIGVTGSTYYRWRREYGGMGVDQARRLKTLETKNARLKSVVADLTLDNVILKEISRSAAGGKF